MLPGSNDIIDICSVRMTALMLAIAAALEPAPPPGDTIGDAPGPPPGPATLPGSFGGIGGAPPPGGPPIGIPGGFIGIGGIGIFCAIGQKKAPVKPGQMGRKDTVYSPCSNGEITSDGAYALDACCT